MKKKESNPILLIAALCLMALSVVSLVGNLAYPQSTMMLFSIFTRMGANSQPYGMPSSQGGTFNPGDATNPGNRTRLGTPPAGTSGQPNFDNQNGTFPNSQNGFTQNRQNGTMPNSQFGNSYASPFTWLAIAGLSLFVVLSLITLVFLIKRKKWAGILAIVLALLTLIINAFVLYANFGSARLMRMGTQGSIAFTIVETLLAIGVIVLLLLPKSRRDWALKAPKPNFSDEDEDEEDIEDDEAEEDIEDDNQQARNM
jgi:hypothetical protein